MDVRGRCLCGAVQFTGTPVPGRGISVCHCGQCRRWAGGPFFAIRMQGGIALTQEAGLTWFRSSDHGERGFCERCGSSLFWRKPGAGLDVAVSAGSLVDEHGQQIAAHIWIENKPDFYDFADDAPRLTSEQATAGSG